MPNFWIYLLILVISTYLIRAVPFACVNRVIENRFIRSFLHYIPYAVLGAMTFPAIVYSTENVASGFVGLLVGAVFAFFNKSLTVVALCASGAALITEALIAVLLIV